MHSRATTEGVRPNARENSQIRPSTIVRAARAAGSHPHLASVLLQGLKSTNIYASSGVIRGIPVDEIVAGTVTGVEQIAARERCSIRQVNMTISLAFLAPNLVQAAVEGRLPRGIGVARLRDAPAEWSRQYAMLGLSG